MSVAQDLAHEMYPSTKPNPAIIAAILQSLTMDDHAREIGGHADRLADVIAQSAAVASGS